MEPTTAKCCGRRRRTALLLLILLLSMTATAAQHVVVAYVTSWSSGLPDPTRMTHINYAFGGVNSARTGVSISNASRLQQIVALKRRNPELKVLLSIGGWGAGGFTPMTSDATKRMAFARDCLRVCQQYGLDGIDLDWEFPGNNSSGESSPAREKQNYSLLCRDLRQVLGDDYLLTMASNYTPGNYDFRGCIQYLDFVNVMCYNMASPPNHHAALYKGGGPVNNGYYSCQMAMNDHINAGIPRQKLVMGMPLYGHESGRGEQSYQRARDLLATGNYVEDWDDRGKVPWIKKKSDGSFYMDFENQRSIEYKCRYILGQKFLGGMYWDYHSDDNQGTLRNTIYKLLLLGETDDPVVRLDGEQMLPDGFRRYSWDGSLTQGQTLRIELEQSDITLQPDEDFFATETDGSLRFLPIDGRYRIRADLDLRFLSVEALDADGQPATLQTDGSGAIWLIGSQGVGKPTFETAGRAWDAEEGPLCLAQPRAGTHQITLRVGRELSPSDVNFKFFLQRGWGSEFTSAGSHRIYLSSTLFALGTGSNGHDDGNIYLRSGQTLHEGDAYRFTVSCIAGIGRVILRAEDVTTSVLLPQPEAHPLLHPWYTLDGIPVSAPARPGIYIRNGKKVKNPVREESSRKRY